MRSLLRITLVLSVILLSCFSTRAEHSSRPRHRHTNKLMINGTFDASYKRDANVVFTYFADGRGACGGTNGPGDSIVALNSVEFAGGAHCFQWITIVIDGKTAQAQIVDECLGCSSGGLDFSQGLFEHFAPVSLGELHGSWFYNSDVAMSSSAPVPSTTSSTSTWTTTVTTVASPSSTLVPTTSATSSTSTAVPSPTSTVPTSTPQDPQMLMQINLALLELGVLLQASLQF